MSIHGVCIPDCSKEYSVQTIPIVQGRKFSNQIFLRFTCSTPSTLIHTWGSVQFNSVQSLSCARLFATQWTAPRQASLSITISQSLLKLMSIKSVMPSNHLLLCRPCLLRPSILPNKSVLFQWVSSSHKMAKVLEFQLQHQSFQWIFRTDYL